MKEEKYWILLSKKIAGEASADELDQLHELTHGNQEWMTTMENLQELWNSRPRQQEPADHQKKEDSYLAHITRLKEKEPEFDATGLDPYSEQAFFIPKQVPFYKRAVTYIIACVLLGGLFLVFLLNAKNEVADTVTAPAVNEIIVQPGSRSKIQLPDGSQVWVNSGTKLTYGKAFSGHTRDVYLDGEAYFDVKKDVTHPFIVHTSGIDIKVLGTAFNVNAYHARKTIEATLVHGSIEVIRNDQENASTIMLKPHEKLIYCKYSGEKQPSKLITGSGEDASSITITPLSKHIADSEIIETGWVYNKLLFEDESLEDVAVKMENWYNLKIKIGDEQLKGSRITGSFVNETVEEALKELQFLVSFNYTIKENEIIITKK